MATASSNPQGDPKCPRCKKPVFFAEQQFAVEQSWHKSCMTCALCNKPLNATQLNVEQSDIYCGQCYITNFGAKKGVSVKNVADFQRIDPAGDDEETEIRISPVTEKICKLLFDHEPGYASNRCKQAVEFYVQEKKIASINSMEVIDYAVVTRAAVESEDKQYFMELFNKIASLLKPVSTVQEMKQKIFVKQQAQKQSNLQRSIRAPPFPTPPESRLDQSGQQLNKDQPMTEPKAAAPIVPTPIPKPRAQVLPFLSESARLDGRTEIKMSREAIIKKLNLSNRFPERISREEVLHVQARVTNEKDATTDENVAHRVLMAILSYNTQGRNIVPVSNQETTQRRRTSCLDDEDDDEDDDALNPMDILLACYLCCDKEVQQILCKALFTCKLAFPFIYTDRENHLVLSKWSLRDIVVEFRDQNDRYVETSLISDYPFPVVSFMRIGELPTSKSRLLNLLLNGNDHATFFHRDCTNGGARRAFTSGLVEAAVFLPSGSDDARSKKTAFLATNLRGDLLEFDEQSRVLAQISQVVVVLLEVNTLRKSESLKMLRELQQAEVLLLLFKSEPNASSTLRYGPNEDLKEVDKAFIAGLQQVAAFAGKRNKPQNSFILDIQQKLFELVFQVNARKLDTTAISSGVALEESGVLLRTKQLAQTTIGNLASNIAAFKQKNLQLQEIWFDYSKHYKMLHSSKADPQRKQRAENEMKVKKEGLQNLSKNISPFLQIFLSNLISTANNELQTKLWLQWLKLFFDLASRDCLPGLLEEQRKLRNEFQELAPKTEQAQTLQKRIELQAKLVDSSSVGLEHVFREVGQLFEANCRSERKHQIDMDQLPLVFAKLLLWGVPLEILDGDACNIPSTWISAILKCCNEQVGNKKIYIISVLGLQSSGKSTLLNTMFGLKFAVSAGRCTRGAFLQLVPVESGMPFDYIAVIDTEGLRAPELALDKHHHDNELATLVIGLGDVTIINIKGENAEDMKDVLQIAIHAFIRMKMANKSRDLHRHCVFIHQNVPAVGAKEKMQEATFKMQQTLDAITREAAEGEGLDNVTRFGDVLEFSRDNDIFYMPDLWQGNPPMAPVNPGYAKKVQEIKHHLLHIQKKNKKSFLGFADFTPRVNDLWKAIMSEDFVFSFRNSIELKAYTHMESVCLEVMNEMEEATDDWVHKSASIQIKKCLTADAVTMQQEKVVVELRKCLHLWLEKAVSTVTKFFDENQYAEYTVQWKERKSLTLNDLARSLETRAIRKLQVLCEGQKVEVQQVSRRGDWERSLLERAQELAKTMSHLPEAILEEEFEKLWQSFVAMLSPDREERGESTENKITEYLGKIFCRENHTLQEFLNQMPLRRFPQVSEKSFIDELLSRTDSVQLFQKPEKFYSNLKFSSSDEIDRTTVFNVALNVLQSVKLICDDIAKETSNCCNGHLTRIHRIVSEGIARQSSDVLSNNKIKTTKAFEVKLAIVAFRLAYPTLVELDKQFYENRSTKSKLVEVRNQMWNFFKNIVQKQSEVKVAADFYRDHLATVMKKAINERMGSKLKSRMINDIGRTKYQLIVLMLSDMAKRDDFNSIIEYTNDQQASALQWVTGFINGKLFSRSAGEESVFLQTVQSSLIEPMFAVTESAAKDAAKTSSSLQVWISRFCKVIEIELAVNPHSLQCMSQYNSAKVEDMLQYLLNGLAKLKADLTQQYAEMSPANIKWFGDKTLYSDVLQSIWGCNEQCPFCNEPCCKSIANHYETDGSPHCCIQHRPKGVKGGFYVKSDQLAFKTCENSVSSDEGFGCGACKKKGKQTPTCRQNDSDPQIYHPFKEYKKYFPEWEIDPDCSNTSQKFWSWFAWTFRQELKEKYKKDIEKLPAAWESVSKKEAIDSLRSLLD